MNVRLHGMKSFLIQNYVETLRCWVSLCVNAKPSQLDVIGAKTQTVVPYNDTYIRLLFLVQSNKSGAVSR